MNFFCQPNSRMPVSHHGVDVEKLLSESHLRKGTETLISIIDIILKKQLRGRLIYLTEVCISTKCNHYNHTF